MIHINNVTIRSGPFTLDGVSLEVPAGDYAVLMGKTGCGKTTLLETVAGLKNVTSGRIILGETDVTDLKPAERNIGYVPQDGALFTNMTVRDQLGFALVVRRIDRQRTADRVNELAVLLEIEPLLNRTIDGLSGGEKQRVALGRALSFGPSTLLLDEPLSALDADTRAQMIGLLKRAQIETGVTCLHVTHNPQEAIALADVCLELREGRVEQVEPQWEAAPNRR